MSAANANWAVAIRGPITLITVGALFVLNNFTGIGFEKTWPVLLIVFGLLSLLRRGVTPPPPPPPVYPPPNYTYTPPPPSSGGYAGSTYSQPGPARGGFGTSSPAQPESTTDPNTTPGGTV